MGIYNYVFRSNICLIPNPIVAGGVFTDFGYPSMIDSDCGFNSNYEFYSYPLKYRV